MYRTYKNINWPQLEAEISDDWKRDSTFQKSITNRIGSPAFVFYEGPPSANGMPGIHHVISRSIKDIFCRYKTMQGYIVERKAGWDTHGLPVELQVEKRLGIKRDDIGVKISVEDYNAECKKDVMKYTDVWDELTRRIGYWVDMQHPYITYENSYIETLWFLLKMLYDKKLLYKGYTIQPFSPAAGTGLSSHELNQPGTYKMVRDTTVVAQFKVKNSENDFILAWTTTPWTLPSNTGLAVGKKIDYVKIATLNQYTGKPINVILAKVLASKYFNEEHKDGDFDAYKTGDKNVPWKLLNEFKGSELVGTEYEQLLPYAKPDGKAFVVVHGDFVSTEDGTGIVHLAPSFGADDFKTARENNLGSLTLVDKQGKFTPEMGEFAGEYVKEQYLSDEEKEAERIKQGKEKYLSVDERLSIKLKTENKAFKVEKYEHTYPHCWRTDKPILYYPLESWFIKTTAAKERLVELNKTINWKPKSTGEGRFGNWLENLVDWNLSRSRYWGTPLPIWRTEDGSEEKCIGSVQELFAEIQLANQTLGLNQKADLEKLDLHKPFVDNVILVSPQGKEMRREPDLIDVWFDSGAMPYAQWGLKNNIQGNDFNLQNVPLNEGFKSAFPADFIAEGVDQTRGWFFTLHAISTLLFDSVAYKAVVSNGLVLDKAGNKMSKRLGNTIEPFGLLDKYGADAVRWYMLGNAAPWDNLKFDPEGVAEVQRKFFGTLYNTYSFFALYANIDGFKYAENEIAIEKRPELDRWILSLMHSLIQKVTELMDDFDPTPAIRAIDDFVNENLSNWFVRLSRRRFWKGDYNEDKISAYQTLYTCLKTVSQLMAPFAPFYADRLFNDLNKATKRNEHLSVHLAEFPKADSSYIDTDLEKTMEIAQSLSSMVFAIRKKHKLRVRQPLLKMMVPVLDDVFAKRLSHIESLILSETNVKELHQINADNEILVKKIKPDFKKLGPKLGPNMKLVADALVSLDQPAIKAFEENGSVTIAVEAGEFEILSSEVEFLSQDIPGWQVESQGSLTVALDLTLTEELIGEGIAREFVNRIQNMRKDDGFEVTDRILVSFSAPEQITDNVLKFKSYICGEILADILTSEPGMAGGSKVEMDDKEITIKITKH